MKSKNDGSGMNALHSVLTLGENIKSKMQTNESTFPPMKCQVKQIMIRYGWVYYSSEMINRDENKKKRLITLQWERSTSWSGGEQVPMDLKSTYHWIFALKCLFKQPFTLIWNGRSYDCRNTFNRFFTCSWCRVDLQNLQTTTTEGHIVSRVDCGS